MRRTVFLLATALAAAPTLAAPLSLPDGPRGLSRWVTRVDRVSAAALAAEAAALAPDAGATRPVVLTETN